MRIRSFYEQHQNSAKRRGIEFLFDFEDWVNWWEEELGYKWWEKRGCRRGQYVMARFNDRGPYARGNVKCILCSQNVAESIKGPRRRLSERLDEAMAQAIYKSEKRYADIVDEFRTTKGLIQRIKVRKSYRRYTEGLGKPGRWFMPVGWMRPEERERRKRDKAG